MISGVPPNGKGSFSWALGDGDASLAVRLCHEGIFILVRGRQRTWITLLSLARRPAPKGLSGAYGAACSGAEGVQRDGLHCRSAAFANRLDCHDASTGRRIIIGHPGTG